MERQTSKEMRSKVTKEGYMEISIIETQIPKPKGNEVLIKIEAAPINPSDLGRLLSYAADLSDINTMEGNHPTQIKIKLKEKLMSPLKPRLDQSLSLGNEGAGVVVDAGSEAKEMIGKTVGLAGGACRNGRAASMPFLFEDFFIAPLHDGPHGARCHVAL